MKRNLVVRGCSAALLFATVIWSSAALAEEDEIATDRPDFVESSMTVGAGRFQIETSISGERNDDGTLREHTLNMPTLLRLGFAPNWELRLETDGYQRVRTEDTSVPSDETVYGMTDLSIGLKWHVLDGEGSRPSVGLLLHADLPSGASVFRGHAVRPSFRGVFEWELPKDFSLGLMPGLIYDSREDGHRYVAGIFGAVLGYSWNERLRSFVEIAAHQLASHDDGGNVITFDVGVAWLLAPKIQLDTALYIGTNNDTPDLGWTVGFSIKF